MSRSFKWIHTCVLEQLSILLGGPLKPPVGDRVKFSKFDCLSSIQTPPPALLFIINPPFSIIFANLLYPSPTIHIIYRIPEVKDIQWYTTRDTHSTRAGDTHVQYTFVLRPGVPDWNMQRYYDYWDTHLTYTGILVLGIHMYDMIQGY